MVEEHRSRSGLEFHNQQTPVVIAAYWEDNTLEVVPVQLRDFFKAAWGFDVIRGVSTFILILNLGVRS
jgi:hypothetical protein